MESKDIFDAALEVIQLVRTKTAYVPTAMRILSSAKQGFEPSPESLLVNSEHRNEAP
jgi:hypothetical protein